MRKFAVTRIGTRGQWGWNPHDAYSYEEAAQKYAQAYGTEGDTLVVVEIGVPNATPYVFKTARARMTVTRVQQDGHTPVRGDY